MAESSSTIFTRGYSMSVVGIRISMEDQFLNKWFSGNVPDNFSERVEGYYGAICGKGVEVFCDVVDNGVIGFQTLKTKDGDKGYHGLRVEIYVDDEANEITYNGDWVSTDDDIWHIKE